MLERLAEVNDLPGYISNVACMTTMLIPVLITASRTRLKEKFPLRIFLCCSVYFLIGAVCVFLINLAYFNVDKFKNGAIMWFHIIKFFLYYVLIVFVVTICYDVDFWGAIYCTTAGYCVQHISARIDTLVDEFLIPDFEYLPTLIISLIIAAACFIPYYFLVKKTIEKSSQLKIENKWQLTIAVIVNSFSIVLNTLGLSYSSTIICYSDYAKIGEAMLALTCVFSITVAFLALMLSLSMRSNKFLSEEKAVLKQLLSEKRRRYEQEKENIQMINVKCHDLKHQVESLKGRIYDEEIEEISKAVDFYDSSVNTGNDALDVVFSQKSIYCKQNGIRFTCMVDGKSLSFVPQHELYALFLNALDNAIVGVKKLPEEKRVISVTSVVKDKFVNIRVENYYEGEINLENGLPVTSKDAKNHGYGIKSMQMIAERHAGKVEASVGKETFILDIFLSDEN